MARLTNLVDADITAISDIYGLEITRCQPIAGGAENSSFLLNARGQDYVLTFYETRSFAKVEKVALLLKHLAEHGYHTNRGKARQPQFKFLIFRFIDRAAIWLIPIFVNSVGQKQVNGCKYNPRNPTCQFNNAIYGTPI